MTSKHHIDIAYYGFKDGSLKGQGTYALNEIPHAERRVPTPGCRSEWSKLDIIN